jgi:photosystem II stability/assembly factor-like uncharacterized protein
MRSWRGKFIVLFFAAAAGLGLPVVAAAAPGSVPGFVPSSTSWTSERNGWVLGFSPCAQEACAALLRTFDGGQTWLPLGSPPVSQTPEHDQVRVRFANNFDGMITDGHQLLATHTAGVTWQRVPLPENAQIGAIAANDAFMYAIVSSDKETRLYSSPLRSTSWAPVPQVELAPGAAGDVVARGRSAYVAVTAVFQAGGYWSTTDGRNWQAGTPPCDANAVTRFGLARDRTLFALCSHDPGRGFMAKDLYRAEPDGSFTFVSSAPPEGITTGFDAASRDNVAIGAVGAGAAFVHRGSAGGTAWDSPFIGEEQPVFDLAFTDSRHGTMVLGGPGWPDAVVYRTTDAGVTWTPLAIN